MRQKWPEPGEPSYLLGDSLALSGLELIEGESTLAVRLQWQALADIPRDYTAFVHVLDSEGGAAAQADVMPRSGLFPTGYWPRGAVVDAGVSHDPIHRHKDVLSHTIAVVENVRPPLEHEHLQAGFGEVGGAGQAVVTTADNDSIVISLSHPAAPRFRKEL